MTFTYAEAFEEHVFGVSEKSFFENYLISVTFILMVVMSIIVLAFNCLHFTLVLSGRTTIEWCQERERMVDRNNVLQKFSHNFSRDGIMDIGKIG